MYHGVLGYLNDYSLQCSADCWLSLPVVWCQMMSRCWTVWICLLTRFVGPEASAFSQSNIQVFTVKVIGYLTGCIINVTLNHEGQVLLQWIGAGQKKHPCWSVGTNTNPHNALTLMWSESKLGDTRDHTVVTPSLDPPTGSAQTPHMLLGTTFSAGFSHFLTSTISVCVSVRDWKLSSFVIPDHCHILSTSLQQRAFIWTGPISKRHPPTLSPEQPQLILLTCLITHPGIIHVFVFDIKFQ